jgi:hypothetical protein
VGVMMSDNACIANVDGIRVFLAQDKVIEVLLRGSHEK